MKAPPTSHTVLLANPENAHFTASLAGLNFGSASCSGANSAHLDSTAPSVMATTPVAAGGIGSSTKAATMPANRAKKFHAFCASPVGGGSRPSAMVTAMGIPHRHTSSRRERPPPSCIGTFETALLGEPANVAEIE